MDLETAAIGEKIPLPQTKEKRKKEANGSEDSEHHGQSVVLKSTNQVAVTSTDLRNMKNCGIKGKFSPRKPSTKGNK